jgi:hypothetical protein
VRDCRTTDNMGCKDWEDCLPLNDPSDPQHGACISDGTTPPPPPPTDNGAQQTDQGVGTDPGVPPVQEDAFVAPDLSAGIDTSTTSSSGGGCTVSKGGSNHGPLSLVIGCLSFIVWFTTRQRKHRA